MGYSLLFFCRNLRPILRDNQQLVGNYVWPFWTELLQWPPVSGNWSILPSDHPFQKLFVQAHSEENVRAQGFIKAPMLREHWRSVMQNRLEWRMNIMRPENKITEDVSWHY